MSPDDVRMTARLVVEKRVHCVSDEAVEAMAARVLELEAERASWALSVKTAEVHEREACAAIADAEQLRWRNAQVGAAIASDAWQHRQQANVAQDIAEGIRARGAK